MNAKKTDISVSEINLGISALPDSGWAIYRLPGDENIIFTSGKVKEATLNEKFNSAFIIAPFYSENYKYWQIENTETEIFKSHNDFKKIRNLPFFFNNNSVSTISKSVYCKMVEIILRAIKDKKIEKAVPARTLNIQLDKDYNLFSFYKSLLDAYTNAFVYMLSTPATGTWIGCTPELLLKAHHNSIQTIALAGTRKVEIGPMLDFKETFSDKEIIEQEIVKKYIQSILTKYCSELTCEGLDTIQAGNVYHLASYFKGKLTSNSHLILENLLKELHPTPAVCGLPLKESKELLVELENFDRSLYSGFLGPSINDNIEFFVNLRCMQVFSGSARLYAGAGIVEGSVPEKNGSKLKKK